MVDRLGCYGRKSFYCSEPALLNDDDDDKEETLVDKMIKKKKKKKKRNIRRVHPKYQNSVRR